jgi:hypothetical protein
VMRRAVGAAEGEREDEQAGEERRFHRQLNMLTDAGCPRLRLLSLLDQLQAHQPPIK